MYFTVLFQEVRVVAAKFGLQRALLSKAFAVDLIPGAVMALLFGQMSLLAWPLLQIGGESYAHKDTTEELVLHVADMMDLTSRERKKSRHSHNNNCNQSSQNNNAPQSPLFMWRSAVDERIEGAREVGKGLYVVRVPTFLPLTDILRAVAQKAPSCTLLQISSQRQIQIKVS
tara:strand:- start:899 stop:1414 length:516 start_codon:yes stop_codon:yes gene_type:complete